MNFRTEITIPDYPFNINHLDQLFSIGSCFATHIGKQLHDRRFHILNNPSGILYNPISIQTCLKMLLENYQFSSKDLFRQEELWHSYYHHGQFSQLDPAEMLENLQQQSKVARKTLLNANRLLITLGTAQVYHHNQLNQVVANCHKLPQQLFTKRRLSVQETVDALLPILRKINLQNTGLQCLMTVSPIRHLRDGLLENQKSKATLLLAIDEICQQLDFVHYFPAYEILMDDLRDYRFYKEDLIHPSLVAQDYVWQQFATAFFNHDTQQLNQRLEKLLMAIQHRPLHPETKAHQQFKVAQLRKIIALENEYPALGLAKLRRHFM